jgi:hypothetical protein
LARPDSKDWELKTNDIFSCEPGIYISVFGGFRRDDMVSTRSKTLEDQIVPVRAGT